MNQINCSVHRFLFRIFNSQGFLKTVYKGKLFGRGGLWFSRRVFPFLHFEIRVFSDFAQSAKRVADLAASRFAVFPIKRRVLPDKISGKFEMPLDFLELRGGNSERDNAKR
jgi:hypothetical protein